MSDTPPTDAEIRIAIGDTISTALQTFYGQVPLEIRVHNHWVLNHDPGESSALLTVRTGAEKGLIHAWMIGLQSVNRARPVVASSNQGRSRLSTVGACRRDIVRTYRIWCFMNLDIGTSGSEDTTNSESKLAEEIEIISDAFSSSPKLGITNSCLYGHEELQFSPIDFFTYGEFHANVAQGSLTVHLSKTVT